MNIEQYLNDWRNSALAFESQINRVVIGQKSVIRQVIISVFTRGHVLLEGNVGVGKTTLLRAVAQGLGGNYQRIEGTIDLMPADLIYYTYLDRNAKPCIDPGPLLANGEKLSIFFFNEINRARPQVHSVLLRVMAERCVSAFNSEHRLPYIQVFADRNRVEREETFELPAAARDRFLMEIGMDAPVGDGLLNELMFNSRYHDVDQLVAEVDSNLIPYYQLNEVAQVIQQTVTASKALQTYALALWKATSRPQAFGISLSDVDITRLIQAGASPRGMSFLIQAAKVRAWLENRTVLFPEDLQAVFKPVLQHRIFLQPMYAYRSGELLPDLFGGILEQIAAP
ncbi:MAG: MoxR family ATPase [Methylococcaceae bacterium]|nr:MoxR family ATPase [Methylococcaceae bacterium]